MRDEELPAEAWPDQDEAAAWSRALENVAARIESERGVIEPTSVSALIRPNHRSLWANFGDLRIRVAGDYAELSGPDALFDEVDGWVAFDRDAGPGRVLDRDHLVIEAHRESLPAQVATWTEAATRVFADVEATTALRWQWAVTIHDDEPDWDRMRAKGHHGPGVYMSTPTITEGDEQPRRPLVFPQVWVEASVPGGSGWGTCLGARNPSRTQSPIWLIGFKRASSKSSTRRGRHVPTTATLSARAAGRPLSGSVLRAERSSPRSAGSARARGDNGRQTLSLSQRRRVPVQHRRP